ncbi:YdeI/OmpD-associated family protein [Terriglobus tenax]|uniref:YdeI/OmpD-associated family protein n=1 Tax=Terriglobus tenax TaxID=1111115 RepID=UPI0021DFBD2C|nr:YdeI/OmpD-associated family protein [Terriglobus tenax]
MMVRMDARVDAYIAKAQPFAQPILNHIREVMHKALPDVQETIKWSMPFFTTKSGRIIANMAAFKAHASFGLWSSSVRAEMTAAGFDSSEGMGTLGKITSVKDLPADKQLVKWAKAAAAAVEGGESLMKRPKKAATKPLPEMHPEFAAALKKSKTATKVYAEFSPSCQREYLEWINEAKRDATRTTRVEQAVAWIAEGKQRNWKYQNC